MLVFFRKKQAVLYSVVFSNTSKINHLSAKACRSNWDLTVIQMSRHCRNIRQVYFSRYWLDALLKSYQVIDKRWQSKLKNWTIFPLWTEVMRQTLACCEFRRKSKQYHLSLVILLGSYILQSYSDGIFNSYFSEISLLLNPACYFIELKQRRKILPFNCRQMAI